MKKLVVLIFLLANVLAHAQTNDKSLIKEIYDAALQNGKSYPMLHDLCTKVGHRLSGSPGAAAAVEWGRHTMDDYGFDSVWLQPVMVPIGCVGNKKWEGSLIQKK